VLIDYRRQGKSIGESFFSFLLNISFQLKKEKWEKLYFKRKNLKSLSDLSFNVEEDFIGSWGKNVS